MPGKAIFLDRDGTINEDVGYLYKIEDLYFLPGAIEALQILQKEFLLFIITNQPGISRGIFSRSDFLDFTKKFLGILEENGVKITEVFFCPHTKEENCRCRKPGNYFLKKAEKQYNLDIRQSYIIGDHSSDIETGQDMGINTIYVLSGHGKKHLEQLSTRPDHIAKDLYQAALWINRSGYRDDEEDV